MASRKNFVKDDTFYSRVLQRSLTRFVDDLDTTPILDLLIEKEFLAYSEVRDIQELTSSSDKARAIISKVSARGYKGYKVLKQLLKISKQEHLAEYLDQQEAELEKKIMAEMPQVPVQNRQPLIELARIPDDKELINISSHIGMNWELLGPFLGVPSTTVDQIKLDNSTTKMRIYRLLYVWRGMMGSKATITNLFQCLQRATGAVNINWDELNKIFEEYDQKRQTGKFPEMVGNVNQHSSYSPFAELGRTRVTGVSQSNEFEPDLSGKSFPQEKIPKYVGVEESKGNKEVLSPFYKNLQNNNPDVYQVYQLQAEVKKNQRFDSGGADSDEEMTSNYSQDIPLPAGIQPESIASSFTQAAAGGSDVAVGGVQGDDSNKNMVNDETDAARNFDVEQELANNLSQSFDTIKIREERPGSAGKRDSPAYFPLVEKADIPSQHQTFSGNNVTGASLEGKEQTLLDSIVHNAVQLKKLKEQKDGKDNTDAVAPPKPYILPVNNQEQSTVGENIKSSNVYLEERKKRVRQIFESENELKGRLKVLSKENVQDLLGLCGDKPMEALKGGFGEIFVSKEEVPGINMKIVLKKVKCDGDEKEQKMRSLTSEKLCARAMHFGIVPLFGIREDPENKEYYFLTPYMEKGSLNDAIEKDNNLIKSVGRPMLNKFDRLRIMYQIASAIDFLHTPILPDVRGMILHMDIKSLNIVLDKFLNARLIDFGLAREMKLGHDHTKTTSLRYFSTGGYDKLTRQQILERHDDYRCFGVVMRELLTGKKPSVEACPEYDLKDQTENKIRRQLMSMWKDLHVTDSLITLSTDCIKEDRGMESDRLVKELKEHLTSTNTKRYRDDYEGSTKTGYVSKEENKSKQGNGTNQTGEETLKKDVFMSERDENQSSKQSAKCDICLMYSAVEESLLQHVGCVNHINVCVSCMRNSYCNPIHCHSCDTAVTPTIGHNWAALLISGYDHRDYIVKCWKEDVNEVRKVITSKCPLVMGVSSDCVQTVCPEESSTPENMFDKIEEAVNVLKSIQGIHTLLVYYSGHYKPDKGGFELVHSKQGETGINYEKKYLSKKEFEEVIANILYRSNSTDGNSQESKRAIIFLDCCAGPAIRPSNDQRPLPNSFGDACHETQLPTLTLGENVRIVQINACRPDQSTALQRDGSMFRKFLVQCLTREALGGTCANSYCDQCTIKGDFITVETMLKYLADHIENYRKMDQYDPVMNTHNISKLDAKIGYNINFKVDLKFTLKLPNKTEHVTMSQRMFTNLLELQILLFGEFVDKMQLDENIGEEPKLDVAEFNGIICIEIEKGPKGSHRDKLETLDKLMTAWNARRELIVTLRALPEIEKGMVGIFLQSGQNAKRILDHLNLKESNIVTNDSKDFATTVRVSIGQNFEKLVADLANEAEPSVLHTFSGHLVDIEDAVDKMEKDKLKELHIVFPCKNNDRGEKIYRSNFICYQLKREEDLH